MKSSLAWFTYTILRKLLIVSYLCSTALWAAFPADAQEIDLRHPESLSPYIFGHNLEHTRAAVNGGLSAQPMLTLNLAWSSPEESAQWVEYCNGSADTEYGRRRAENGHPEPYHVRFWSLGNEMGYGHMEGPQGSSAYAELAQRHVDAMLAVSATLPPHSVALIRIRLKK